MSILFAQQTSTQSLLAAVLFTLISLPVGGVVGYLLGYRYKRLYLGAARELASLRGENFRGEQTTIGIPRPAPDGPRPSVATPSPELAAAREAEVRAAVQAEMQAEMQVEIERSQELARHAQAELQQREATLAQREAAMTELREALDAARERTAQLEDELAAATAREAESLATSPLPQPAASGTEAWQIAQLHREQITMQMKMDELHERIATLTHERDTLRSRVDQVSA